jgi:hypothetical protein
MKIAAVATYKHEGYVPGPHDPIMTNYELAVDYIESIKPYEFSMERLGIRIIDEHLVEYSHPIELDPKLNKYVVSKDVMWLFGQITDDHYNPSNYTYIDVTS